MFGQETTYPILHKDFFVAIENKNLEILSRPSEVTEWVSAAKARGECVGLVPTMGALHEGHLSLARAAMEECDRVVASIFVNPTQFAPGEDFDQYPRDLQADREKLADVGVDLVFAPAVDDLYPAGNTTTVDVGPIGLMLEGATRPTHFRGVATVVMKLLQAAPADRLYLGQKDYQQTVVLRRVVQDLFLPVEVVVCPTVREVDGLAMSSRNAYLTDEQRSSALMLSQVLRMIAKRSADGERRVSVLREEAEAMLLSEPGIELDYLAFLAPGTVDPIELVTPNSVVAVAAWLGETRLIDNEILA